MIQVAVTSEPCRSCGAAVMWLSHHRTGRPAPIDAEPAEGGNIAVNIEHGMYRIVPPAGRDAYAALFVNHFATCPQASGWHKR